MQRASLLVGCLLVAGLAASLGSAAATHDGSEHPFAFDHEGGNEWWVEVSVDVVGQPDEQPDRVYARDEGDTTWHALSLRDWGNWAGSFHIEPGNRVQFRAVADGSMAPAAEETSCWFTHPDGVEQCPSDGADGFDATFDAKGGNEWWVQVGVKANEPIAGVDARADGGAWHALEKKSWGDWAGSFHVPDGSLVEFRARDADGETDVSGAYRWPSGEPVDGGGDGGDGSGDGSFDATFRTNGGNEWWVEVYVDANGPLSGVDARADGGSWHALEKKSWGAWAGSFNVPEGSLVEFRALSAEGDVDVSGAYRWPEGEPVSRGSGGAFDASFRTSGGNEWWVEVYVDANEPIAGVDARADDGVWHALSKRDWGAWAGSFHVEDGSLVQFRALSDDGDIAFSGHYRWPAGTMVEDATWPREGSYLRYRVAFGEGAPPGAPYDWTELNVSMEYVDGRWEAVCEGWDYYRDYEEQVTKERVLLHASFPAPRGPTQTATGADAKIDTIGRCDIAGFNTLNVTGRSTYETRKNGEPVDAPSWQGDYDPECQCQGASGEWHRDSGLTFRWHFAGRASYDRGALLDTDAPIAPGDEPKPRPAHAWPREGSFVEYETRSWYNGTYSTSHSAYTVRFTYASGEWRAVCDGTRTDDEGTQARHRELEGRPWFGPLRIHEGDHVVMDGTGCLGPRLTTVAKGTFAEDTARNGDPHRATAWWGDEPDGEADRDHWWDVDTGLLLRWEEVSWNLRMQGILTDTDAPLSSG